MAALWNDLSVAIRQFRRQPGFAFAAVSTLALAIGANIAVFSVVNAVLFRALPFKAPERLVWITSVRPDNPAAPWRSTPEQYSIRLPYDGSSWRLYPVREWRWSIRPLRRPKRARGPWLRSRISNARICCFVSRI